MLFRVIESKRRSFSVFVFVTLILAVPTKAEAQDDIFQPLGDLEGGEFWSNVLDLSPDGLVAVGNSHTEAGPRICLE